jgi:indole-3-glycerol phosphate synthase
MTAGIADILARIVEQKKLELPAVRARHDEWLQLASAQRATRRPFAAALRQSPPAVIAEVKQASPSKGLLTTHFQPATTAIAYEHGGAACLSVLTDQDFFQGSLTHLQAARAAVSLPVIRKDFTIDAVQIAEAAAHGADAILLIAAILSEQQLRDLREYAELLGLAALVEVHDATEQQRAIASGASIIGVNNRDLRSFQVSLDTSLRLAESMPNAATLVSESGINTHADVARLQAAGYHAFLVGEHLMKSTDPAQSLRELRGC